DRNLYEEGLGFYLTAMGLEPKLLEQWSALVKDLGSRKEAVYSGKLLEIDRSLRNFRENHGDLMAVLKLLATVKRPEKKTELAILLEEAERNGQTGNAADAEVKKIARQVEEQLQLQGGSKDNKTKLMLFNERFQSFQTGKITAQDFAISLKELTAGMNMPMKVSRELGQLMQIQKRMQAIEGVRFFRDFESYADSVKGKLFRNHEERKLDQEGRQLEILGKLIKLELSFEEWKEMAQLRIKSEGQRAKDQELSGDGQGKKGALSSYSLVLSPDLEPHMAFYGNAGKRDQVLFENLRKLMKGHSADRKDPNAAILIAGGFHAEGLTQNLREENISYLLLMPKIESIPETSHYRQNMQGEVSWRDYYEVENGEISFYKAFVRGTRDRLLEDQEISRGQAPADQPITPENSALLKSWREQIIRDMAQKGQIEKASEYTKFIDETAEQGVRQKLVQKQVEKAAEFVGELRKLEAEGRLNQESILQLLKPATMADEYSYAGLAAGDWGRVLPARDLAMLARGIDTGLPRLPVAVRQAPVTPLIETPARAVPPAAVNRAETRNLPMKAWEIGRILRENHATWRSSLRSAFNVWAMRDQAYADSILGMAQKLTNGRAQPGVPGDELANELVVWGIRHDLLTHLLSVYPRDQQTKAVIARETAAFNRLIDVMADLGMDKGLAGLIIQDLIGRPYAEVAESRQGVLDPGGAAMIIADVLTEIFPQGERRNPDEVEDIAGRLAKIVRAREEGERNQILQSLAGYLGTEGVLNYQVALNACLHSTTDEVLAAFRDLKSDEPEEQGWQLPFDEFTENAGEGSISELFGAKVTAMSLGLIPVAIVSFQEIPNLKYAPEGTEFMVRRLSIYEDAETRKQAEDAGRPVWAVFKNNPAGRAAFERINQLTTQRHALEQSPGGIPLEEEIWLRYQQGLAEGANRQSIFYNLIGRYGSPEGPAPGYLMGQYEVDEERARFVHRALVQKALEHQDDLEPEDREILWEVLRDYPDFGEQRSETRRVTDEEVAGRMARLNLEANYQVPKSGDPIPGTEQQFNIFARPVLSPDGTYLLVPTLYRTEHGNVPTLFAVPIDPTTGRFNGQPARMIASSIRPIPGHENRHWSLDTLNPTPGTNPYYFNSQGELIIKQMFSDRDRRETFLETLAVKIGPDLVVEKVDILEQKLQQRSEMRRRDFLGMMLKTSAAVVAAAVVPGLTGCGSQVVTEMSRRTEYDSSTDMPVGLKHPMLQYELGQIGPAISAGDAASFLNQKLQEAGNEWRRFGGAGAENRAEFEKTLAAVAYILDRGRHLEPISPEQREAAIKALFFILRNQYPEEYEYPSPVNGERDYQLIRAAMLAFAYLDSDERTSAFVDYQGKQRSVWDMACDAVVTTAQKEIPWGEYHMGEMPRVSPEERVGQRASLEASAICLFYPLFRNLKRNGKSVYARAAGNVASLSRIKGYLQAPHVELVSGTVSNEARTVYFQIAGEPVAPFVNWNQVRERDITDEEIAGLSSKFSRYLIHYLDFGRGDLSAPMDLQVSLSLGSTVTEFENWQSFWEDVFRDSGYVLALFTSGKSTALTEERPTAFAIKTSAADQHLKRYNRAVEFAYQRSGIPEGTQVHIADVLRVGGMLEAAPETPLDELKSILTGQRGINPNDFITEHLDYLIYTAETGRISAAVRAAYPGRLFQPATWQSFRHRLGRDFPPLFTEEQSRDIARYLRENWDALNQDPAFSELPLPLQLRQLRDRLESVRAPARSEMRVDDPRYLMAYVQDNWDPDFLSATTGAGITANQRIAIARPDSEYPVCAISFFGELSGERTDYVIDSRNGGIFRIQIGPRGKITRIEISEILETGRGYSPPDDAAQNIRFIRDNGGNIFVRNLGARDIPFVAQNFPNPDLIGDVIAAAKTGKGLTPWQSLEKYRPGRNPTVYSPGVGAGADSVQLIGVDRAAGYGAQAIFGEKTFYAILPNGDVLKILPPDIERTWMALAPEQNRAVPGARIYTDGIFAIHVLEDGTFFVTHQDPNQEYFLTRAMFPLPGFRPSPRTMAVAPARSESRRRRERQQQQERTTRRNFVVGAAMAAAAAGVVVVSSLISEKEPVPEETPEPEPVKSPDDVLDEHVRESVIGLCDEIRQEIPADDHSHEAIQKFAAMMRRQRTVWADAANEEQIIAATMIQAGNILGTYFNRRYAEALFSDEVLADSQGKALAKAVILREAHFFIDVNQTANYIVYEIYSQRMERYFLGRPVPQEGVFNTRDTELLGLAQRLFAVKIDCEIRPYARLHRYLSRHGLGNRQSLEALGGKLPALAPMLGKTLTGMVEAMATMGEDNVRVYEGTDEISWRVAGHTAQSAFGTALKIVAQHETEQGHVRSWENGVPVGANAEFLAFLKDPAVYRNEEYEKAFREGRLRAPQARPARSEMRRFLTDKQIDEISDIVLPQLSGMVRGIDELEKTGGGI
ncbi:MAG: hypothetical protein PHN49_02790, partial [Candidatus Omnitrophica bacterium]|nr:hypothetical protein [Candidatus Omnitrophota bacterium]